MRGMPDVTMRLALPQDASMIAPMHVSCWREAYAGLVPQRCFDDIDGQDWVAHWRRRLERPEDVTTVALQDGHVVGLATVGPAEDLQHLPPQALWSLYVVRALWGSGLSSRLLRQALGDRPASLWAFEGNERARRFYARGGWRPTGERRVTEWIDVPELRLVGNGSETLTG